MMIHDRSEDRWYTLKDFRSAYTLPERLLIYVFNLFDRLTGWMGSPIDALLTGAILGYVAIFIYVAVSLLS